MRDQYYKFRKKTANGEIKIKHHLYQYFLLLLKGVSYV